jgi:hypothetical protein
LSDGIRRSRRPRASQDLLEHLNVSVRAAEGLYGEKFKVFRLERTRGFALTGRARADPAATQAQSSNLL